MDLQPKTRQQLRPTRSRPLCDAPPLQPRLRRAIIGTTLALTLAHLIACTTDEAVSMDDRWHASTAARSHWPDSGDGRVGSDGQLIAGWAGPELAAPVLPRPGIDIAHGNRFWDARRDAEFGAAPGTVPTAATDWPTPPRPNEQVFRFRTLKRN